MSSEYVSAMCVECLMSENTGALGHTSCFEEDADVHHVFARPGVQNPATAFARSVDLRHVLP